MRQLALAVLAVSLAGCSFSPGDPTPSGPVRVSGRVLTYGTSAPVAGAAVTYGSNAATSDATGVYALTASFGQFETRVNGAFAGVGIVTGPSYRGDLLAGGAGCVARYGSISDAATNLPIANAQVRLGDRTIGTDAAGWYSVDFGCPEGGVIGFNTTFLHVTHPLYTDTDAIVGRGIFGVSRLDVELKRR